MKLIVGLGNPGKEYENTRHNVGFMVVDNFLKSNNIYGEKRKFDGIYLKANINGHEVMFLKPQKYMNLSGEVVRKYVDFFKIDISDVLIINDDLDLELGSIKLKYKGSSGGHNGLKNIEFNLGTNEYKRFKVGISNDKRMDTKDYVLGKFSDDEMKIVNKVLGISKNVLDDFLNIDFEKVMSKYN